MEASLCCACSGSLRQQVTVETMLIPTPTYLYNWGAVLSAPPTAPASHSNLTCHHNLAGETSGPLPRALDIQRVLDSQQTELGATALHPESQCLLLCSAHPLTSSLSISSCSLLSVPSPSSLLASPPQCPLTSFSGLHILLLLLICLQAQELALVIFVL